MAPRRKTRQRRRSDRQAKTHSQESESRRATSSLIIERAIGRDPPTSKGEVSEANPSGTEEKSNETDELLDGVRPLEKRLWLHDC